LMYDNIYKWNGNEITMEAFHWMANGDMYIRYLKRISRARGRSKDLPFYLEYNFIGDEMKK